VAAREMSEIMVVDVFERKKQRGESKEGAMMKWEYVRSCRGNACELSTQRLTERAE
jgi:hypothetical protein